MNKEEMLLALGDYKKEIDKSTADLIKAEQTKNDTLQTELKGVRETLEAKANALQAQLDEIATSQEKQAKSAKEATPETMEMQLKSVLEDPEFRSKVKKNGVKMQVKTVSTDYTGIVNPTISNTTVRFDPDRALAFMGNLRGMTIGQDKDQIMWLPAAYTSNVGYVGECVGNPTPDEGTVQEKYRKLAKISAKLPLSNEMLTDYSYVASAFRMKMAERAQLFADKEIFSGDGDDTLAPNHVYGLLGQSTPFAAGNLAGTVPYANIGDLFIAIETQIRLAEQPAPNIMWINPETYAKYRLAKDQEGQYLFKSDPVNGDVTFLGVRVVQTTAVPANEMLVGNTNLLQLWTKQAMDVKFSNINGTDFEDDCWLAVLFMRMQVLVEDPDQTSLVYVADVEAGIAALEEVVAP